MRRGPSVPACPERLLSPSNLAPGPAKVWKPYTRPGSTDSSLFCTTRILYHNHEITSKPRMFLLYMIQSVLRGPSIRSPLHREPSATWTVEKKIAVPGTSITHRGQAHLFAYGGDQFRPLNDTFNSWSLSSW